MLGSLLPNSDAASEFNGGRDVREVADSEALVLILLGIDTDVGTFPPTADGT
jgi:hypothetical protein